MRPAGFKQTETQKQAAREAKFKHGHCFFRIYTPEYNSWRGMLRRCLNPKATNYRWYGARGVTVCQRWKDFRHFYYDMGQKPSPKHTIERIDNSKGYEPGNCRWTTQTENNLNRRNPAEAMRAYWENR